MWYTNTHTHRSIVEGDCFKERAVLQGVKKRNMTQWQRLFAYFRLREVLLRVHLGIACISARSHVSFLHQSGHATVGEDGIGRKKQPQDGDFLNMLHLFAVLLAWSSIFLDCHSPFVGLLGHSCRTIVSKRPL